MQYSKLLDSTPSLIVEPTIAVSNHKVDCDLNLLTSPSDDNMSALMSSRVTNAIYLNDELETPPTCDYLNNTQDNLEVTVKRSKHFNHSPLSHDDIEPKSCSMPKPITNNFNRFISVQARC